VRIIRSDRDRALRGELRCSRVRTCRSSRELRRVAVHDNVKIKRFYKTHTVCRVISGDVMLDLRVEEKIAIRDSGRSVRACERQVQTDRNSSRLSHE